VGYQEEIGSGREAFAHLIRAWHERNGWSHRILPGLAEVLDLGRLHSSQVSMLRNRKLASPGPEVFLALGRINQWIAASGSADSRSALTGHPELLEALGTGSVPLLNDDDGRPLGPGGFLEIFVGQRQPPAAFDLRIASAEAPALSFALAELLTAGRPWRLCREAVLGAYPAEKAQRRERFAAVMAGQRDFEAAELESELLDLKSTLAGLGAAGDQELSTAQFLTVLRRKAAQLADSTVAGATSSELGAAIRQELGA
jgi:hypothetical protein